MKQDDIKSEMQRLRHTIWAVAFFLTTTYLMYHGEYIWGALNATALLFHDLLSISEMGEK